jgi:hypothetical protein
MSARRSFVIQCVACFVVASAQSGTVFSADLSEDEQRLLRELNTDAIESVVAIADKVGDWKSRFEHLKANSHANSAPADELNGGTATPSEAISLVFEVADSLKAVVENRPELDRLLQYQVTVSSVLKQRDQRWQNAHYDAERFFDLTEEEFREEAKRNAMVYAAAELAKLFDTKTFRLIEQLRNPAQYARQFLKGQFAAWISQPQEHEILQGLKFTIKPPDANTSVFDPQGGLTAVLEYAAFGNAKVEAKGLYFEYDPGKPLPKPNIDHLQVQPDWKSLLPLGELSKLGGMSVDLGLGFTLSEIEPPLFDKADENGRRGGIKFKAAIRLSDGLPSISGKGVVYPADLTVVWLPPGIKASVAANPPVPIGTTGAAMHGYDIEFLPVPNKEQVTARTKISTAAPGSARAFHLDAGLTIPIPVNFIKIDGTMRVGAGVLEVGNVWGEFNFKAGKVEGEFNIPGKSSLPIGQFYSQEGHFLLTTEGFRSTSKAKLFGQTIDEMDLHIDTSGHGSITARQGIDLPGLKLEAPLNAGFEPGFQRVWARANGEIKGVDLGYFNLVDVALEINADSARKPCPVEIVARAWRASASVELNSLAEFNYEKLLQSLREQCLDMYKMAAEELAQLEGDARDAAAKAEQDLRKDVAECAEKYGVARLSTGNKQVDETLGRLADEGKEAGKKLADERANLGKLATQLRENPGEGVQALVDKAISAPEAWGLDAVFPGGGGVLGGVLGGGGGLGGLLGGGGGSGGGGSSGPSRAEIEAQVRLAKTLQLTDELCAAIERRGTPGLHFNRYEANDSPSGRRYRDRSELSVQFRSAQCAPSGNEDACLALLVPVAGFTDQLVPGKDVTLTSGADVKTGTVRFQGLLGDGKSQRPRAQIRVASMSHGSQFPAERIARREIQQLIERHLPEVDIEGPREFVESQLAVHNKCDEPIAVWVQTEWRTVRDKQFAWEWSPAPPGSDNAYRFQIGPGKTELLQIDSRYPSPPGDETSDVDIEDRPLTASRVRLWAESESGEQWMMHRSRDLWLVEQDPALREVRGYFDEQIHTYTHVIEPQAGGRVFSERLVRMTNKTSESLTVQLRYRAHEGGQTMWRSVGPFEIPPGAAGFVTTDQGMKLRASQLQFSARSAHLYFGQYEKQTLDLVDEQNGRRLYFADKIGLLEHVFDNPDAGSTHESK